MKHKSFLTEFILVLFILSVLVSSGWTYQGSYVWTKRMGGDSNDIGLGIATDRSGNVYIVGAFEDTVNFGADFGATDTKTSAGERDIFVTRINAKGSYGWTRRMGGTLRDYGIGITTDHASNVYIVGYFEGTVDFGADFGSTDTKTSDGGYDIFITRINANGTYGWTRRMGSASTDLGESITADPSGSVYVTGSFEGTVDFGTDFGTTDAKTSSGDKDIFITRINANGTYGWTRRMGGALYDSGYDITTDPSGNLFIIGEFQGTVDFGADFGAINSKESSGDSDIFITKVYANGNYGGTKRIGGISEDHGHGITTDPWGNVYITGGFQVGVNFGADFGVLDIKWSAGAFDGFVTRINANGTYGWTRRMGGPSTDSGRSITTDPSANIYVTGIFQDTANFGTDFGLTDIKTSAGFLDIFVTRLNATSTYGWTNRIGGTADDDCFSIATDLSGNFYVTGYFESTVNFGSDFGVTDTKTSNGERDIFAIKLTTLLRIFDGHDFDGDSLSDETVWRPTNGRWYIKDVGNFVWGHLGDIPVNGDYNGDGTTDIAVWRPSNGRWYIRGMLGTNWGILGDIPVPGDYDGDGTTDIAVWRPSNGRWYIRGGGGAVYGNAGDIPVPADYDGDGDTDIAVWRPSNGMWYIRGMAGALWGRAGDIPVPCNYNGVGPTEIAIWRPLNGRWYIRGMPGAVWGAIGDIPVPGDYNGDGHTDIAVWRPSNGRWYIKDIGVFLWGTLGDIPLVR